MTRKNARLYRFVSFFIFGLFLTWQMTALSGCSFPGRGSTNNTDPPAGGTAQGSAPVISTDGPDGPADVDETANPAMVVEPPPIIDDTIPTPVPTEKPPYVRLDIEGPDVPERETAEDDFFADAAFMGNSLVEGFQLYSGLTTCDVYASTSMSVVGVSSTICIPLDNGTYGTILQGVAQKPYGKIYILLGINEIGYDSGYFKDLYGKMLDTIIESQPEADIYIMALTPVSAYKSSTSDTFNMTRVNKYNTALYELAEEKGVFYLDICTALSDENGYLPSDVTTDGVHFSPSHYGVWLDYLRTHYV